MSERTWSYTTPNPHRSPVSIEVGGDAEVLAEMGGFMATAAHSDFHLSWVIQVPGPGRYTVVKEADDG